MVGWNALAGLVAAAEPEQYLIRAVAGAIRGDYAALDHL
jgi:hypothetical protein